MEVPWAGDLDVALHLHQDMQNFMENYSDFSAAQLNTGKHVTLVSELSRLVDARTLMQVLPAAVCHMQPAGAFTAARSQPKLPLADPCPWSTCTGPFSLILTPV